MLQRLVRMALPNPTAADTVLGRLILATLDGPQQLPAMLTGLQLADFTDAGAPTDGSRRVCVL